MRSGLIHLLNYVLEMLGGGCMSLLLNPIFCLNPIFEIRKDGRIGGGILIELRTTYYTCTMNEPVVICIYLYYLYIIN